MSWWGGGWKGRTQGGQNGILNRTGREGGIGIIEKLRGTKKREMDKRKGGVMKVRR